jgi:hypothetical protein
MGLVVRFQKAESRKFLAGILRNSIKFAIMWLLMGKLMSIKLRNIDSAQLLNAHRFNAIVQLSINTWLKNWKI